MIDRFDILCCPRCGGRFREARGLECESCAATFPVLGEVPRFVPSDNYAASFGWQWNRYRQTQLDSHTGTSITRDRFFASTGWTEETLRGKRVLDLGCGAGRFAEIALSCGAMVVAVDYSTAVEACWANLRHHGNLLVLQANVYDLPLRPESFDFVYCLGVLQHTPDPHGAFTALPPLLRPGGRIAVDFYIKRWLNFAEPRYWLRPITRRMPAARLFRMVERSVPALLSVSNAVSRVPKLGRFLRKLVPVANYTGVYPLGRALQREWSTLDTFDWLAPAYDRPQDAPTLRRWLAEAGLEEIEVFRHRHLVGRGSRSCQRRTLSPTSTPLSTV